MIDSPLIVCFKNQFDALGLWPKTENVISTLVLLWCHYHIYVALCLLSVTCWIKMPKISDQAFPNSRTLYSTIVYTIIVWCNVKSYCESTEVEFGEQTIYMWGMICGVYIYMISMLLIFCVGPTMIINYSPTPLLRGGVAKPPATL